MSMLAGPRRKQKVINLRAKNNAWSNDSNKFGQRMLEKMGWSSGKGLGANENGIVEHVVAKYKNDEKGLGFEDRNDQWIKHEDDFNALLASLSNTSSNEDKIISGVSLEDKSKKSKTRIHYHKFTRGKDLSRYSEKELANILGKKSLKNKEKCKDIVIEEVKTTDQVFTEKGSMEDYFKNKLAARKSNKNLSLTSYNNDEYTNSEYGFQGFAGTDNKHDEEGKHKGFGVQTFSFYSLDNNLDNSLEQPKKNDINLYGKKKKRSKNSEQECIVATQNNDENICSEIKIKKKKQFKSNTLPDSDARDVTEEIQTLKKLQMKLHLDSGITDKKKKRSKILEQECTKSTQNNETICSEIKNKKKNKLKSNTVPDSDAKGVTEEIQILKKSQKKKHLDSDQWTQNVEDYESKNKKCKKGKEKIT